MSDVVIKVEDLSKQYRLGTVGTGTLSHDLNRFWAKLRGREDPYLTISESNDRTQKGNSEYVWALKDLNFEVKQGEILGVIGRNGAGKSTLLKILSQITRPTTGSVKMRGRVGSLLEVGTGFHPDLTGRENIYINGAILGMRKWEIKNKLDEIIDFAGIERYVDTPVKRYSSGMKVRLGFAIAAHLEPEILIVDEVLAVGDAEFQKKCLGKMGEVSKEDGRTILFVSHNIQAVTTLCSKFLYIKEGGIASHGPENESVRKYLSDLKSEDVFFSKWEEKIGACRDENFILSSLKISQEGLPVNSLIENGKDINIKMQYFIKNPIPGIRIYVDLMDEFDLILFRSFNDDSDVVPLELTAGNYCAQLTLPKNILGPIRYKIRVSAGIHNVKNIFSIELPISVTNTSNYNKAYLNDTFRGKLGLIFPWVNEKVFE